MMDIFFLAIIYVNNVKLNPITIIMYCENKSGLNIDNIQNIVGSSS
ncbi:hypothetical protein GCM10010946_09670 [Undibacterium squillarum]|uniref:Uncharacterized protein n=1 Tax=Undibacterium squillarum TaxID=1131567 RepID=A0ABQ2XV69_9BURK|nr:hypothetical protein GCM10010946_09670 [Undibacterium squillarum]